jgi:hypothetical protein
MPEKVPMRIELTGDAKKHLADIADRYGMTQLAVMSRLVEFFVSRDEVVQASIVGRFPPEYSQKIIKRILEGIR